MPQPEGPSDSYPRRKKGPPAPPKDVKEADAVRGTSPENDAKKDPSVNLFEDNIREQKKEGA